MTNLQCSLSRRRMVFGLTRRSLSLAVPCDITGTAVEFSLWSKKGALADAAALCFGVSCDC